MALGLACNQYIPQTIHVNHNKHHIVLKVYFFRPKPLLCYSPAPVDKCKPSLAHSTCRSRSDQFSWKNWLVQPQSHKHQFNQCKMNRKTAHCVCAILTMSPKIRTTSTTWTKMSYIKPGSYSGSKKIILFAANKMILFCTGRHFFCLSSTTFEREWNVPLWGSLFLAWLYL